VCVCSTVLRFSIRGPSGPLSSSKLVGLLRNQLLREKSDYLLFRVLRVDTVGKLDLRYPFGPVVTFRSRIR